MKIKLFAYTKAIIIISFVISAGLVFFIAMNANRHLASMSHNNSELYSAYRILELLKVFKGDLQELETREQAYLSGPNTKSLERLEVQETETKSYLKDMEKYFLGRPEEEKFYSLKHLTYKKIRDAKNQNQQAVSVDNKVNGSEVEDLNSLKKITGVIEDIESSLGKTTQGLIDNSVAYVTQSKKWSALEVLLGVIVLFVALVLLLRDLSIRNKLEAELRVAKNQADDNAMMKEQFMANMSHEIRTPMNAILGFTDLLQKTELSNKQGEYARAIQTSGSNLLNIINDILDFSKIEAGKLVIEKIAFNIIGLVDSLRVMFAEKCRQKGIRFQVHIDQGIPEMVFGDPTRLTQILVNLINNAIKFTDSGIVTLSCEMKGIENNTVKMIFRVKDTGIGIPPDKLDTIFERFNQGNRETTRKYGGTGLGLSIVRDLVELQHGEITVRSKMKQGSEFIVTISYVVSHETSSKTIENFKAGFSPISKNKMTVLMAEDNELNQKLSLTYLKGFGLNVDVAENGQVAIDKLREKNYDLVLMDIQMPLLDGYHASQQIRKDLKLDVPIIAMTAHIMSGEKEKCISYGMNDYISKPFKEKDLYEIVSRYLKEPLDERKTSVKEVSGTEKKGVVDFVDIDDMARGNTGFVREMIDLFLQKNPEDIQEAGVALKNGDYVMLRSIAHRMKTSVGFMGLKHLGLVLAEIEAMAENRSDQAAIVSSLEKVERDCITAREEFKAALKSRYA